MSAKKKVAKKKKKPVKKPKKKPASKHRLGSERSRPKGVLSGLPNLWVLAKSLWADLFPISTDSAKVVRFNDRGKVNQVMTRRSTNDIVWFQNMGKLSHSFDLDHWPFMPPQVRLTVGAGKMLGPFPLDPSGTYNGTISFINNNPAFGGGGGPGDPQFDTGG